MSAFSLDSARFREGCAEHRQPAGGRFARSFGLYDVPVFGETPVFDTYDVERNPVYGLADAAPGSCGRETSTGRTDASASARPALTWRRGPRR